MAAVRSVDFNALPLTTRERFTAAVSVKDADDSPLIREVRSVPKSIVGYGLLALFGLLALRGSLSSGFGVLGSADAWQGEGYVVFDSVVAATVVYAALALGRLLQSRAAMPFAPGIYLFVLDLVDARARQLRIYPLSKLSNLHILHHSSLGMHRTTFTFVFDDGSNPKLTVTSRKVADDFSALWRTRQAEIRQAIQASDNATIARRDPFFDVKVAGWTTGAAAGESEPFTARHLPGYVRWIIPIAVVIGLAIAIPLIVVRNSLSDAVLYKDAIRLGTEQAYSDYLRSGRQHVDEIKAGLPRAAFNDARRAGTATALRGVLSRYPNAGLGEEVKRELGALYAAALSNFRKQAATADATLVPFMEQLLAALNDAGSSTLQVRFTRPTGEELRLADARIAQAAEKGKGSEIAPAARHFGADSAGPREKRIIDEMTRGFRAIFPSDILNLSAVSTANPNLPVMDIAYRISPSGVTYKSEKSARLFMGVRVHFAVRMSLPASPDDWRFKLDVEPPNHFVVNWKLPPGALEGVAPDEQVYVVMAERAFDQLGQNLRTAFFRPDSDAYKRAAGT